MADPKFHYRGDMVVMIDWTATDGVGSLWTNFCGATGITLSVDNAIKEQTVGDCEDWTLPAKTVAEYGAQTWNVNINASMAKQNRDKLLRAMKDQTLLPIRIHIVPAVSGEVEYIDGTLMLPSLSIDGIGNLDNAVITMTLNGRFRDGVEFTDAA